MGPYSDAMRCSALAHSYLVILSTSTCNRCSVRTEGKPNYEHARVQIEQICMRPCASMFCRTLSNAHTKTRAQRHFYRRWLILKPRRLHDDDDNENDDWRTSACQEAAVLRCGARMARIESNVEIPNVFDLIMQTMYFRCDERDLCLETSVSLCFLFCLFCESRVSATDDVSHRVTHSQRQNTGTTIADQQRMGTIKYRINDCPPSHSNHSVSERSNQLN